MIRPLPWTSVERWAERNGFAESDRFEWLWDRVSGLDRAYLEIESERLEREIDKHRKG